MKKESVANKLYLKYLKLAKSIVGSDTTYLGQLNGAGKKLLGAKFKGVYPSDKIPHLTDLSPYCILNLDSSKEQGSHWIALVKSPNENKCMVYDSFGRKYKRIIPILDYSGNGRIINTDDDAEQKKKIALTNRELDTQFQQARGKAAQTIQAKKLNCLK